MKRSLTLAALVALASSMPGCQTKHLTFLTYTKTGVDMSLTDAQPTSLVFGYKRFEGAVIPVDVCLGAGSGEEPDPPAGPDAGDASATATPAPSLAGTNGAAEATAGETSDGEPPDAKDACATADPDDQQEAMSVYAAMDVDNSWIRGLKVLQLFATGESAVNAARDPTRFAHLVRDAEKAREEKQKEAGE